MNSELNKEQQEAANFLEGICSVIAVPGSGKTRTMMERIGILVKRATATSQLILMFSSSAGMISHLLLGHADFEYALLLSIGAFIGGLVGARLSVEIKENSIRLLISIAIIAAAVKLFIDSFGQ